MRLFVCEFITAGGWQGHELPAILVREGDMMLTALLGDLQDAGYQDLVCTRDSRLPPLAVDIELVPAGDDIWQTWREIMQAADAVWLIAPESDSILYRLTRLAADCHCQVLGCTAETVQMATSKRLTATWLAEHKIPAAPVLDPLALHAMPDQGWIIKPDDGVGGIGVRYFPDLESLQNHWQAGRGENLIVQPFIPGIAASMTVICQQGRAVLLACNEQYFAFAADGTGHLDGLIVNGLCRHRQSMTIIADQLAAALAGETACIGVDLVLAEQGPVVIEINPRLTTAYAGLRQSLGCNPAGLIMAAAAGKALPAVTDFRYLPVRINL